MFDFKKLDALIIDYRKHRAAMNGILQPDSGIPQATARRLLDELKAEEAEIKQMQDELRPMLEKLPKARQREAMQLHYFDMLNQYQISRAMDLDFSTVFRHLAAARQVINS